MHDKPEMDTRLENLIGAAQQIANEDYDVTIDAGTVDLVDRLGNTLRELAKRLAERRLELQKLDQITVNINAGLLLDDILENVYFDFAEIIP